MLSPVIIKELISLGGNIIITGIHSPVSLKEFASLAKKHNTHLTIKAGMLSPVILRDILKIGKGCITIEV